MYNDYIMIIILLILMIIIILVFIITNVSYYVIVYYDMLYCIGTSSRRRSPGCRARPGRGPSGACALCVALATLFVYLLSYFSVLHYFV